MLPLLVALLAADTVVAGSEVMGRARAHGWSPLIDRLVADGVDAERLARTFADARLPAFTGLPFTLRPREHAISYKQFLGAASVAEARRCRDRHAAAFHAAEQAHGVPAALVAAIFHIESGCGRNTGTHRIFHRLARLAMANAPGNLEANLARAAADGIEIDAAFAGRLAERARYLEATFYPEVRAMFELAERERLDPLEVRGSYGGAFGYPQFLPTSFLRWGVDANGDGRVSLYDARDAAASCANYLARHGFAVDRRAALWSYNHSPRVRGRRACALAASRRRTVAAASTIGSWPAFKVARKSLRSAG